MMQVILLETILGHKNPTLSTQKSTLKNHKERYKHKGV